MTSLTELEELRMWLTFYLPPGWEVWTMQQAYEHAGHPWPKDRNVLRWYRHELVIAGSVGEPGRSRWMETWAVHSARDSDGSDHWRFGARGQHRHLDLSVQALALDAVQAMLRYTGMLFVEPHARGRRSYPPLPLLVQSWHADGRQLDIRGALIANVPLPAV